MLHPGSFFEMVPSRGAVLRYYYFTFVGLDDSLDSAECRRWDLRIDRLRYVLNLANPERPSSLRIDGELLNVPMSILRGLLHSDQTLLDLLYLVFVLHDMAC